MVRKNWIIAISIIILLLGIFLIKKIFFKNKLTPAIEEQHLTASLEIQNKGFSSGEIQSGEKMQNSIEDEISFVNANTIHLASIKAVYSSGWIAGGENSRKEMIKNMNDYGFNAIVIDIKDEAGHLSYQSDVQTAIDIGASRNMIKDVPSIIKEFHENGIYVIGRIVTFKDPTYANAIKDIAFQTIDGSYWKDKIGNCWPNPYNKNSWNYPIALAKEATEFGFDEIQFDYVRFPSSEGKVKQIAFGFDSNTLSKSQIINQFLTKVMDELSDYKVNVSADVFGIITKRDGDFENIGQDYYSISKIVDVICPMVYPSHYGRGEYKIAHPDLEPYHIIYDAMSDALTRVSGDSETAIARPYLQDFTASWLGRGNYQTYGNEAVRDQIKACYDLGITSFTLWDPSNQYCYEALPMATNNLEE